MDFHQTGCMASGGLTIILFLDLCYLPNIHLCSIQFCICVLYKRKKKEGTEGEGMTEEME